MELIMKSESVQIATCFCHGSIKLHYVVPICANKSFLFNIFISPCITFIQLLHLILLVKERGNVVFILTLSIYDIPFIYPFYYNHLFTHLTTTILLVYSPCIALPFIHLLCFNYIFLLHLILILFNNSILLLLQYVYFFFLFSELGDNSFSHKGGRNVMIPNHAQPAYPQGRMYRHFLSTYRHNAIRGEA